MERHPDVHLGALEIGFQPMMYHQTAFRRQIYEAVAIKMSMRDTGKLNLNNKQEYNRCILPELEDKDPSQEETMMEQEKVERLLRLKRIWKEVLDLAAEKKLRKRNQRWQFPAMTPDELLELDTRMIGTAKLRYLLEDTEGASGRIRSMGRKIMEEPGRHLEVLAPLLNQVNTEGGRGAPIKVN